MHTFLDGIEPQLKQLDFLSKTLASNTGPSSTNECYYKFCPTSVWTSVYLLIYIGKCKCYVSKTNF